MCCIINNDNNKLNSLNLFVDGINGSDDTDVDGKSWDTALATLNRAITLLYMRKEISD